MKLALTSAAYLGYTQATTYTAAVCRRASQPVHADVCGVRLQIVPGDIIDCHVPPYEAEFRIELRRRS